MHVTFRCPACQQTGVAQVRAPGDVLACTHCGWRRIAADSDLSDERPASCLVCGNADLWRQKDFPQTWGLLAVAAGALFSSIAWYFHLPKTALGILMAFALADLLLYVVMPDLLVCYRCRAAHRGAPHTPDHPAFNHELAERYRQEKLRLKDAVGRER
jgi:hypothetical protein